MNKNVNLIKSISYAAKSGISQFNINPSGLVSIVGAEWISVPYVFGSVEYTNDEIDDKAGVRYEIKLSGKLRERINPPLCIIRIEFEDDDTHIIGDPDHPVRIVSGQALLSKNFKVSHLSWSKPYILAV